MYHLCSQISGLRLDPIITAAEIFVKIPLLIQTLNHLYLYPQITS